MLSSGVFEVVFVLFVILVLGEFNFSYFIIVFELVNFVVRKLEN